MYEYHIEQITFASGVAAIQATLTALGQVGWVYVESFPGSAGNAFMLFIRPNPYIE